MICDVDVGSGFCFSDNLFNDGYKDINTLTRGFKIDYSKPY